jgi:hypothetical protein
MAGSWQISFLRQLDGTDMAVESDAIRYGMGLCGADFLGD